MIMVFSKYSVLVTPVVTFIVVHNLYKKMKKKKHDADLFIFKNNENKTKYT